MCCKVCAISMNIFFPLMGLEHGDWGAEEMLMAEYRAPKPEPCLTPILFLPFHGTQLDIFAQERCLARICECLQPVNAAG